MYSSLNSFNSLVKYSKKPYVAPVSPEEDVLSISPKAIFSNTAWTQLSTWSGGFGSQSWQALAGHSVIDMNADGSVIYTYGTNSGMIKSTDSGVTWVPGGGTNPGGLPISSIVASTDSRYIMNSHSSFYSGYYGCYSSNDYGVTYAPEAPSITFEKKITNIAMSANGQYRLLPFGGSDRYGGTQSGYVYVSSDYGATYKIPSSLSSLNKRWQAAGMTQDGSIMWVGNWETYLYKSTNYGVNWVYVNIPNSTPDVYSTTASTSPSVYSNKISLSPSGAIVALTTNTAFCVSIDYGNTWTVRASGYNTNYNNGTGGQNKSFGISMRSDGLVMVTTMYQNFSANDIYYSTDLGSTWTSYVASGSPYRAACFAISPNGNVIYSGNGNSGITGSATATFRKITAS
jgi:hypothetical protein